MTNEVKALGLLCIMIGTQSSTRLSASPSTLSSNFITPHLLVFVVVFFSILGYSQSDMLEVGQLVECVGHFHPQITVIQWMAIIWKHLLELISEGAEGGEAGEFLHELSLNLRRNTISEWWQLHPGWGEGYLVTLFRNGFTAKVFWGVLCVEQQILLWYQSEYSALKREYDCGIRVSTLH